MRYESKINDSKYKKAADITVGDVVIIRNYMKKRKFDPTFLPEKFIVVAVKDYGRCLHLEREIDGVLFLRHPDDVKKIYKEYQQGGDSCEPVSDDRIVRDRWNELNYEEDEPLVRGHTGGIYQGDYPENQNNQQVEENQQREQQVEDPQQEHQQPDEVVIIPQHQQDAAVPRRCTTRQRKAPERLGATTYNAEQPLQGEGDTVEPWWPGWKQGEYNPTNLVQLMTPIRRGMMYTDV